MVDVKIVIKETESGAAVWVHGPLFTPPILFLGLKFYSDKIIWGGVSLWAVSSAYATIYYTRKNA